MATDDTTIVVNVHQKTAQRDAYVRIRARSLQPGQKWRQGITLIDARINQAPEDPVKLMREIARRILDAFPIDSEGEFDGVAGEG